jgi:hypothetical protein
VLVLRLIAGFGMIPPSSPPCSRACGGCASVSGRTPHRGAAQWRQVFGMTTMMANFDGAHAEKKLAAMGAGLSKL